MTWDSEGWGPWIEHDGKGCPCVGTWVKAKFEGPPGVYRMAEGRAGSMGGHGWDWRNYMKAMPNGKFCGRVVTYQIRKPRGLTILESILADTPERVDA